MVGRESWIACKVIYFIDSYGTQFTIRDQVVSAVIEKLEHAGIPLAANRLWIEKCAPPASQA